MGCPKLAYNLITEPRKNSVLKLLTSTKSNNKMRSGYVFGFNGQEMDNEIAGAGNITTAEFWEYDSRLGRRWNVDPVVKPWESGYATFGNNPILLVDINGDDSEVSDLVSRNSDAEASVSKDLGGESNFSFKHLAGGGDPPERWKKGKDGVLQAQLPDVEIKSNSAPKSWWGSFWSNIENKFSDLGDWFSTAWSHRGGFMIAGRGAIKIAIFGHGWSGNTTIPQEAIEAKKAVIPAILKKPSKYKPSTPDPQKKVIVEATKIGNKPPSPEKQAETAHQKSEPVRVHSSYLNGFDTTYSVSNEDYDSVSKVVDGIAGKRKKK